MVGFVQLFSQLHTAPAVMTQEVLCGSSALSVHPLINRTLWPLHITYFTCNPQRQPFFDHHFLDSRRLHYPGRTKNHVIPFQAFTIIEAYSDFGLHLNFQGRMSCYSFMDTSGGGETSSIEFLCLKANCLLPYLLHIFHCLLPPVPCAQ